MQLARPQGFLLTVSVFCVLLGAPGCTPKPWQGVDAKAYGTLEEHRLLGIAYLESDRADKAIVEFRAIQKLQPGLGFGFVNEAAARAHVQKFAAGVLKPAQRAVELMPKSGWARLVLAQVYQSTNEPTKAAAALEEALRLEPDNVRIVGAMIRQLEFMPGEHAVRVYDLRKQLAQLAAGNLAVQCDLLNAQLERKDYVEAARTLDAIVKLLPKLPELDSKLLAEARKGLAQESPDAILTARTIPNLVRPTPLHIAGHAGAYGKIEDPANLLMREWDLAAPNWPAPVPGPISVTWKDVTRNAGLAKLAAPGLAPAAVGDLDPIPEAGRMGQRGITPIQSKLDLLVGQSPQGLLFNRDNGFHPKTGGTAPPTIPASPFLVDLNSDFALDLYSASPGGDQVWLNPHGGKDMGQSGVEFPPATDQPMRQGPVPPGKGAGVPAVVDLDQDGDLDVLRPSSLAGQPAVRYLRNNGNATFTDLTTSSGLKLPSGGARQVVWADFDGDQDPDLFLVRAEGPSQLFLNRRQDVFSNASQEWGLKSEAGSLAADVADFDRDGDWDLAVAGRAPHGSLVYRNDGKRFQPDPAALPLPAGFQGEWVKFLDYDNDTWLDLAVAGSGGVLLFHNEGGKLTAAGPATAVPSRWVRTLDYDQDGDLDLLVATRDNHLLLLSNEGGNARPWLNLELQGLMPGSKDAQANNSYGIGSEIQALTVWERQKLLATEPVTHIGLGTADRALAVRVLWPHGVPDNTFGPETGHPVHFIQRPQGSCPFLYAWNGEKWEFMGDFNWRSPLGMLAGRGKPVPHDLTQDWLRLPGGRLQAQDGFYTLIATEELREVSYFDQIKLLAVDHLADTEVYVDERFPFGPPDPFRIYTVRSPRLPVSARDENGNDLLPLLRSVDRKYTPVPPGPYRGVRAPHDLILDLGKVPDPSNVRLFLNGWIFPAANSTNVAVSQDPGLPVIPPTLSFGDGRGGWTGADGSIGMPCGKRKTIVLDLSNRFIGNDFRVKLTTTMEIRWDAAFFTSGEVPVSLRQHSVPLAAAELRERGYGTHYREVEDGPDLYDYNRLLPPSQQPDWLPIAGAFTRLGDCSLLLRSVDDQYAIIAPGDELRLTFDARVLPSLAAGWKRDFVLLTDGWTKDTDPNTVTGETVGPLPFHGMKRYPYGPDERFPDTPAHRAWQREWNTRIKRR